MKLPKSTPQQSKLDILYFFEALNTEVSRLQLDKSFSDMELSSYFDLMGFVLELLDAGMLKERVTPKGEFLNITNKGKAALKELGNDQRRSVRLAIEEYCKTNKARIEAEKDYSGDYYRISDNEFRVMLKIYQGDISIFEVNIKVYSEADARAAVSSWHKNASEIYQRTISALCERPSTADAR